MSSTEALYDRVLADVLQVSVARMKSLPRRNGEFVLDSETFSDYITAVVGSAITATEMAVRADIQRDQVRSIAPMLWDLMTPAQRREVRSKAGFADLVKAYDLTLP
jgi:hypothetical protein